MKENLRVTGILNLVFSPIYLFLSIFSGFPSFLCFLILLVSGIVFLNYSKLNNLNEKRNVILTLSIILVPILFVSALINLIGISKISNNNNSNAPNIEPETKKIDVLIKLGVGLIILSMLIFVTTGWNSLPKYIVVILLSVLTLIFFLLHLLFTKKIKLVNSSKLYFTLYSLFLIIIFYALGYYNLLGDYFSINGNGEYLFYTITLILAALVTYSFKKITDSNIRIYIIQILVVFSVLTFLTFLKFTMIQSLLLINIAIIFLRLRNKNEYIIKFSDALMKLFIIISGLSLIDGYSLSLIIFVVVNLLVLNTLNIIQKSVVYEIMSPLLTIIYIGSILGLYANYVNLGFEYFILIYISILTCIYILLMVSKLLNNKILCKNIFVVVYNIVFLIFTFLSFFMLKNITLSFLILRIIMLFSYMFYEYKYKLINLEYYLLPLNITITYISLIVYINNFIDINVNIILLSLMMLLSTYYILIKNKVLSNINLIIIWIINIINIFISLSSDNLFIIMLTLISTIIPIVLLSLKNEDNYFKVSFIYSLLSSYIVLLNNQFDTIFSFILCMVLYLLIYIIVYKYDDYSKWVMLFVNLPLFTFISRIIDNTDIRILLLNIQMLEILIYSLLTFIKNINLRKVLFILFLSFILLFVIFREHIIFGIYVGLISLFLLIYSSIKNNNKSIFIFSLVVFIINILYRLRSVWEQIPFWIYLLVAGIVIIVVATIKEIRKNNNDSV